MIKECLWYNGELGVYDLLDFDPNCMNRKEVIANAKKKLQQKYGFGEDEFDKAKETLYLVNVNNLKRVY